MTLIASPFGGKLNDAYVTISEANTIAFQKTLHNSFWISLSDGDIEAALRQSAGDIDSLHWDGTRLFHDQSMRFPISRDIIGGAVTTLTTTFNIDLENQRIALQEASVHQAISLLQQRGKLDLLQIQLSGVRSFSGGGGNTSQSYGLTGTGVGIDRRSSQVLARWRAPGPRLARG